MALSDDVRVTVLIADYVGIDAASKLNIIGGAFLVTGLQTTGLIAPQHVAVLVTAPAKYVGSEASVSLELRDTDSNTTVQIPGPTGQVEALRVQQIVQLPKTEISGLHLPETLPCQVQVLMGFPGGLPLPPDHKYEWRVEVDGRHRMGWVAEFYVPGPPPPPVFGGPSGLTDPTSMPSMLIDDPLEGPSLD